jgi:small subunit ribosomal protein S8
MSMSDPIADMLTRIRNAAKARKPVVDVPASNLKREIAKQLVEKGFIKKFVVVDDGKQGVMKVLLRYTKGESAIQGLERVSTPGRRVYAASTDIPKVLNGLGYALVSTSQGVLTDHDCRTRNVGGEVICKVW